LKATRAMTLFLAMALLALVFLDLPIPIVRANPVILRVTVTGATSDLSCGTSWANPCGLQHALKDVAVPGDELWVASGTYTPTTGITRTETFKLRNGIALYGGFAMTETLRSERNFTTNVTILSGNINWQGNSNDNSYHVVTGSGVTNTAVLDGFSVTGGNANGSDPNDRGAGVYNYQGNPTLINVTFSGNSAHNFGGGMYSDYWSSPALTNVTFSGNSAGNGGGMFNYQGNPTLTNVTFSGNSAYISGGGMSNNFSSPTLINVAFSGNLVTAGGGLISDGGGGMFNLDSNPTLTNVTFTSNTTSASGGGMYNWTSSPTLTNTTFVSNTASTSGGGMYNDYFSSPTLTNVAFSGNSAPNGSDGTYDDGGGGMYNRSGSPTLTNTTFSGNSAINGGGIYNNFSARPTLTNVTFSSNTASANGGAMYNGSSSDQTFHNTIVWGNTPSGSQIVNDSSTLSLYDSVLQGGCPAGSSTCINIITDDPRLGALGHWGGSTQTVPLLPGSSATNAGNNATCAPTDQRNKPRVGTCDIGAFEFQGFTLTKTLGDNQLTPISSPFATPLAVTLTETGSPLPFPGVTITFTAPASGASAAWSGSLVQTATTNPSGVATVGPPISNSIFGSYAVTAQAAIATAPVTFTLTNALGHYFPLIRR
jgi:predicted outer membrane repeat protein